MIAAAAEAQTQPSPLGHAHAPGAAEVGPSASRVAPVAASMMARAGDTGLSFELHDRFYQISGPINIYSSDRRFDSARLRLYQMFKQEWSGYQGVLRTAAYGSNDALAHLVAGKKVELLSDEQVAMLLVKHVPEEAAGHLPASVLAGLPSEIPGISAAEAVALAARQPPAVSPQSPATGAWPAVEAIGLSEVAWYGGIGLAAAAVAGGLYLLYVSVF
ncbi:MAG: hypothetical protein GC191_12075 [Azospirillum sp.]|nr:hypothetical protein [Azospirillum sp.]